MEEISNKLCSPHRKCKLFFENTNFYPFLCILPFYRVFPNHKGFQSNDHLGYIAPIMPHRSNIKYIFVQPSSSLKRKPNKNLMVISRRVLQKFTLRAFLQGKHQIHSFHVPLQSSTGNPGKLIRRNFGFGACRQRPFQEAVTLNN